MLVTTSCCDWSRCRTTNTTATAFTARTISRNIAALVKETRGAADTQSTTGSCFIPMAGAGNEAANFLMLQPFAIGSNDNTMLMRVYGWRKLGAGDANLDSWIATLMAEFTCTISSSLAGTGTTGPLLATELMADAITLTYGPTDRISISSPSNNLAAHAVVDMSGFRFAEVQFTTNSSSTSCNALVSRY